MNVLYVLGSEPDKKHTFINREIQELQNQGINVFLFVIRPFRNKKTFKPSENVFYAGLNPLKILLNPFINYFRFQKSILFSRSQLKYSKGFDKNKTNRIKIFFAALFAESALNNLLKSNIKIDQVHSHHLFSATLFTPQIAEIINKNYSITIHTLSYTLNQLYLNIFLKKANFLRTVTLETDQYFRENRFNEKIYYIPNCIDASKLPKKVKNENKDSEFQILAIGYFFDKKGFDVLIESCRIIKDKKIKFRCIIIGEGPEKKNFERLIHDYNCTECITLIPYTEFHNLVPYFQSSTVLAVPSRDPKRSTRDGLPTVILEAMAIGLPVVASNFAGITDAIIHEKTGLLVASENDKELADALLRIYYDVNLAEKLVYNSKIRVEELFSLSNNISKLKDLFNTIKE